MRVAVLFVGVVGDRGFNASAMQGAARVGDRPGVDLEIVDGVPYAPDAMEAALRAAANRNDGVIFVGGQGNDVVPAVAASMPDKGFAVVQGNVTGLNVVSCDVLQEQSAFLAGCLAARETHTGVVAHLSGHRVAPGLKGRAAFVSGAAHIDPSVRVLTGFCGTQDDSTVTQRWAAAQIDAGADILFTMLNAARTGAIEACRAGGARQIGNALDWCRIEPDVFIASAVARIDLAVERAADILVSGRFPGSVVRFGLADEGFVKLVLAETISNEREFEIGRVAAMIVDRTLSITTDFDGLEFVV